MVPIEARFKAWFRHHTDIAMVERACGATPLKRIHKSANPVAGWSLSSIQLPLGPESF